MDGALRGFELANPRRVQAAGDEDADVAVTGQVETGADLFDQIDGDSPPLTWRVEPDAPQALAECLGDAKRFLRLVLERIDQHDAQYVVTHVLVESERRFHGVAEEKDHRVRHGARGALQPGELSPKGRGAAAASHGDLPM